MLQAFSQFTKATTNEEEYIAHKLLGKEFQVRLVSEEVKYHDVVFVVWNFVRVWIFAVEYKPTCRSLLFAFIAVICVSESTGFDAQFDNRSFVRRQRGAGAYIT